MREAQSPPTRRDQPRGAYRGEKLRLCVPPTDHRLSEALPPGALARLNHCGTAALRRHKAVSDVRRSATIPLHVRARTSDPGEVAAAGTAGCVPAAVTVKGGISWRKKAKSQ